MRKNDEQKINKLKKEKVKKEKTKKIQELRKYRNVTMLLERKKR